MVLKNGPIVVTFRVYNCYITFSISRIANRMATLRRQLYNELGNTRLSQAMEAVGLDDEEEMWRRLDKFRVSARKSPTLLFVA